MQLQVQPWGGKSLEESMKVAGSNTAVRNHGDGHWNHSLFWQIISPNGGGKPTDELAAAIDAKFGTLDTFKETFNKAAATRFGSEWAWLCVDTKKELCVCSPQIRIILWWRCLNVPQFWALTCGGMPASCIIKTEGRITSTPSGILSIGKRWASDMLLANNP